MVKKLINFRATREEAELLASYAAATRRTQSDILREMIRALRARLEKLVATRGARPMTDNPLSGVLQRHAEHKRRANLPAVSLEQFRREFAAWLARHPEKSDAALRRIGLDRGEARAEQVASWLHAID
jgi:hypothetical protein